MSFLEWLMGSVPTQRSNPWGLLHVLTLLGSVAIVIVLAVFFRNKSEKTRKIILYILVGILLFFEIARRVVNLIKEENYTFKSVLYILAFRPWCAIASLSLMLSLVIKKDWFNNYASASGLLCTIIFFAYPQVGFRQNYLLFDDVYSIMAHVLIFITSLSLMTLGFTNFDVKGIWKTLLCYAGVFVYAFIEIFLLKIEPDPLYFMPNGDVQKILKVSYPTYLIIYILFISIYVASFYLCTYLKRKHSQKRTKTSN